MVNPTWDRIFNSLTKTVKTVHLSLNMAKTSPSPMSFQSYLNRSTMWSALNIFCFVFFFSLTACIFLVWGFRSQVLSNSYFPLGQEDLA